MFSGAGGRQGKGRGRSHGKAAVSLLEEELSGTWRGSITNEGAYRGGEPLGSGGIQAEVGKDGLRGRLVKLMASMTLPHRL